MAITSSGAGSGLDINSIISQLMTIERQPLTKLDAKEAVYQTKISAMGSIKSALSSFQTSVSSLLDLSNYSSVTPKVSDENYVTATATNKADVGAFSVDVLQLAKAQRLTSKEGVFTSATQVLATKAQLTDQGLTNAQLKLTFGTISGTSFDSNLTKDPVSISLTPGSDGNITLTTVRDAINAKTDAGVSASIIADATGSARLVLSSKDTGASMGFKLGLEDADKLGATTLGKLNFDPTDTSSTNFEILSDNSAQDAIIKLNGLQVTRSSNVISDAINGVALTLKKPTLSTAGNFSTSTPVTMTTARDSSALSTNLSTFVSAYNEVNSQLTSLSKITVDSSKNTTTAAVLAGDSSVRTIQAELRGVFNMVFSGTGSVSRLSQLGISYAKSSSGATPDGSITLDTTKLTKMIESDPAAITEFMGAYDKKSSIPEASKNGFAYKLNSALNAMLLDESSGGKKGTVASRVDGLNRSIQDISKQREVLNRRITDAQTRYTKEYTALDVAIATLKQTSASLTSSLASLTSSTSSSS